MIFRNRRRHQSRIAPNPSSPENEVVQKTKGITMRRLRRSTKPQQQQESPPQPQYQQQQQQKQTLRPTQRIGRRFAKPEAPAPATVTADPHLRIEEMNVNETHSGYEVSLDAFNVEETGEPGTPSAHATRHREEFKSPLLETIQEQIRQRQRVHRSQFSVDFPALSIRTRILSAKKTVNPSSPMRKSDANWRPTEHRIPLLGFTIPESSYEDVFQLLRSAAFMDESKAVETELDEIHKEISALERDRNWLEKNWDSLSRFSPLSTPPPATTTKRTMSSLDWDTNRLLSQPHVLNDGEQVELQQNRGLCLSIQIQNHKARESFLSKCGFRHHMQRSNSRQQFPHASGVITLSPDTCQVGGAGTSVQQVSILNGSNTNTSSSFFLSRDNQKSATWGHLPPKLFRRMNQDPGHDVADLEYLSTGPRGCYYAQFRSGECWWGNAVEDHDFHAIVKAWDVYRVVFGPIVVMEDERGNQRMTNSWIILGRDGRAAWKNLPSRLHHRLQSRLADRSAPAEVTLGPGDSYYIKFLDGTVDYCLPAMIAQVCEHIEMHGGVITNLTLHPENSHDFVIRHTQ